jgi:hypothetical protein
MFSCVLLHIFPVKRRQQGGREGTVISTSGGRVKFISNMDVFMCSPRKPPQYNQQYQSRAGTR